MSLNRENQELLSALTLWSGCKKQGVAAGVTNSDGELVSVGINLCHTPQSECPRDKRGYKTGEGYFLCRDRCGQISHAEVSAIDEAIKWAQSKGDKPPYETLNGLTCYLVGHTYACDNCKSYAASVGIDIEVVDLIPEDELMEGVYAQ